MYDSAATIEYAFENEQPVSEHVIPYILPVLIGKMDHRWNAIQPKRDHQESADAVPSRVRKLAMLQIMAHAEDRSKIYMRVSGYFPPSALCKLLLTPAE